MINFISSGPTLSYETFNILSRNRLLSVTWFKRHRKLFRKSGNLFMKWWGHYKISHQSETFLFLQQKDSRVFCNCFCLDRNCLRISWNIFCFRNRFVYDFFSSLEVGPLASFSSKWNFFACFCFQMILFDEKWFTWPRSLSINKLQFNCYKLCFKWPTPPRKKSQRNNFCRGHVT